ncbi:MAG: DUF3019 domain-containing protein [Granulosicoccus sp.]
MSSSQLWRRLIVTLLCAVFSGYVAPVLSADGVQFTAVPNKCISLLKGQTCYQRVQFRWGSDDTGTVHKLVCLWREGDSLALTCWEGQFEGLYRYNLEAAETTSFYLVAGREQEPVIARTSVKVSWVYNNRSTRRSRWRLF